MSQEPSRSDAPYLSTRKAIGLDDDKSINPVVEQAIEKLVGINRINALMEDIGRPWPTPDKTIDQLFERLNINWTVENPEILENLDDRPKVFVANHPYGLPDAFALFRLLTSRRPNIKIFANKLLSATQLNDPRLLFVDPFMARDTQAMNRKSVGEALQHLRSGGDLALFPGRICSHLKTSDWTISDSNWTDQVRSFVRVSGGDLVPLYISGRNSLLFNLSGLIHPRIRTYMLLREFLRGGHNFSFRVGTPVPASQLDQVSRSLSVGNFARSMVYSMKTGSPKLPDLPELIQPELRTDEETQRIARVSAPISGLKLLGKLENHEVLIKQNGYTIYTVGPGVPDDILSTICEIRYRAYASETDVASPQELRDIYDDFYCHLLLWDDQAQKLVGTYRYILPDSNSSQQLVTDSIFKLSPEFRKILPNAMELGRAAILPEYQKSFSPLMLLWRGFLEVPNRSKKIKYLFGPVTMGKRFNPISRELVRRFIMKNFPEEGMMPHIQPKRQLDLKLPKEVEIDRLADACRSFASLGNLVKGFEGGQRNLPVLFRHYANCGCRFTGFAEWRELDNATTGLTILNFKNASPSIMARYFGKEGAKTFMLGR
ncbi:MAG: GNAT family N-acyltransferase [Pseudomonadota bacterium]